MAFKQKFNKVNTVKNFENIGSESTEIYAFDQEYDEVSEVMNVQCGNDSQDIIVLCTMIEKMNHDQMEKFVEKILENASDVKNPNRIDFQGMRENLEQNGNRKENIIEYLKSGTATVSLITSLCTLAKTIFTMFSR